MRAFFFAIGSMLLTSTILLSDPAHAQSGGSSAEPSQRADDLFHKGKALYQASKVREAYEAYAAAWKLKRSYDIAANLANTEMLLGMKRDAADHLAYCARNFPPSGNRAQLDTIKSRFDEARKEVGALSVKGLAPDAVMRIDDKEVGAGADDDQLYVEPGQHVVDVKRAGYEDARQTFAVKAGGSAIVDLTQKKIEVRLPPLLPPTSLPGTSLSPSTGPSVPLILGGAAVSVTALATGVVFTLVSNGKASDAATAWDAAVKARGPAACASVSASGCQQLHDSITAKSTFGSVAAWSFIGAGAVGVSTLVYGLVTLKKAHQSGIQLLPMVTGKSGGVVVGGAW